MPTKSKSPIVIDAFGDGRRLPRKRPPTHPGEMLLEEFLKPLEFTQTKFASLLDISFARLNDIIHARRAVTVDTALRLHQVLGMPADFWLGLQQDWDLWHAQRSDVAQKIAKLKPLTLPPSATRNTEGPLVLENASGRIAASTRLTVAKKATKKRPRRSGRRLAARK